MINPIPWNRWYSITSNARAALWIVPFLSLLAATVVKRIAETLGGWMVRAGWYDLGSGFLALTYAEAQGLLDRLFTMNLSFLVFTFGSLLVAIQIAGGQYTPRIIATTLLRDNVIRWIVGLFVFTLIWSNRALVRLSEDNVQQFQVFLTAVFGLASLIAFLVLIDYSARLLRPVRLVARVARSVADAIDEVYPAVLTDAERPVQHRRKRAWGWLSRSHAVQTPQAATASHGCPARTIRHGDAPGIVIAVNIDALISEARRAGCAIEVLPQVGDFVASGAPLLNIYGTADGVDERKLHPLIAFGTERTIEQDPIFGFRILVDIALKALSPAINDPTTAVLAIDQLNQLLRLLGPRSLRTDEFTDPGGELRLILRTPNWEDYVQISCREIRAYGANNLQVARRLRAMIENLMDTVPERRRAALEEELDLLNRVILKHYTLSEDLALARVADAQGLGGSLCRLAADGAVRDSQS